MANLTPHSDRLLGGRLLDNLLQFARTLRRAGLPIGPGKVLAAVQAVEAVGMGSRHDFYWALQAVFVQRASQRALFDQAFHLFWRNPKLLERLMSLVLPQLRAAPQGAGKTLNRRLGEALMPGEARLPPGENEPVLEPDGVLTWSDRERLQHKDFEQMSLAELALARQAIARLKLPVQELPARRFAACGQGTGVHLRATFRKTLRSGHGGISLVHRQRRTRPPQLVMLCDISGSMNRYSRMLLHFAHSLSNDRARDSVKLHAFVFATRLSNISRYLKQRDVDQALAGVTEGVADWNGGTRIGQCLGDFNRHWSRRVLAQGAVVLLVSDGLDRDTGAGLAVQMQRLHKSCRHLIWLNPLLRYEGFEPRALGMQAILPHVDELRPMHNVASLAALCRVLSASNQRGRLSAMTLETSRGFG